MERRRPRVFVLTDGSGGAAASRLEHSRAILDAAGAAAGEVFGEATDRTWYAALLAGDQAPFQRAVALIVAAARRHRPGLLVTDAVDGHNPLHDLCQAIGSAVAARLAAGGQRLQHLVARATADGIGEPVECWPLEAEAVGRKRLAVAGYVPLAEEARHILATEPAALRQEELLRPTFTWPRDWLPAWEAFGRRRVAEGRFAQAITYAGHVRPIATALLESSHHPQSLRTPPPRAAYRNWSEPVF